MSGEQAYFYCCGVIAGILASGIVWFGVTVWLPWLLRGA